MALPATIDPAAPATTDLVSAGDDQIRALKQFIIDIFGLVSSPTAQTAAAFSIAADGTVTVKVNPFAPNTSDGAALGSATKMWSDLFLASGGVVNFNNGNMTITHAAGKLTLAGGNLYFTDGVPIIPNARVLTSIDAAGTGTVSMIGVNSSDNVVLGDLLAAHEIALYSASVGSNKIVSVGDPDSGGAGYRMLRIPN